jgi:DNA helicase-2/ATP-dependent DNA helicase PcrA
MLAKGVIPYQILALTFTNKAAAEMKDRIFKLVGDVQAKAVVMGTFHSVFYKILRVEAEKLGFSKNLTVYDTDDSKSMLRTIIKEMSLDPKVYLPNYVLNRISAAKSSLLSAEEYARNPEILDADARSGRPMISEIFMRYTARLRNADAMDFDDLLYYMNVLLRDFPEALYKYQNRYRYILVDEYQDTNFAQYLIVKKLAAAHHNLCVVGDDAQSIYAFRGANIQNILNFRIDYPEAATVKLEQNYRSTSNIVNAANAIIKNNSEQIPKEVWTDKEEGAKIRVHLLSNETEEANTVANSIFESKLNFQLNNSQFAILYRTNAQSRALEEALIKRHIPYKIYAGMSFYKRKEIKDVLAYFRLVINNYDEESLRKVINYPLRGIGSTTMDKVIACAKEQNTRIWNVIAHPDDFSLEVNMPTRSKLQDFASRIRAYTAQLQTTNAYDLAMHIVTTTGVLQDLKDNIAEKERLENVEELLDSVKEFTEKTPESSFNEETGELIDQYFPTLDRYMESIALLTDEEEKESDDLDKVKLMTIHAAKGLEFDHVYLTGMEENLFPSSLSIASKQELEEERRLFYVAITRAKESLTLTHCQTRYKFGSLQFCEKSRFVDEIPTRFLKLTEKASAGFGMFAPTMNKKVNLKDNYTPFPKKNTSTPTSSSEINLASIGNIAMPEDITMGVRVYHQKFGYGNVTGVEGSGADKKAMITFESVGLKTLLLKYAKLVLPEK